MIEIKNVSKSFGNFNVFENISITVDNSSIYGLVGYNGAGKTTLLKTIAGIYKPDSGEVLLDGYNSYDNGAARAYMFYIPDDIYFMPNSTLESMGKFYKDMYPTFDNQLLCKICGLFALDMHAKLNKFSKGMKRQAEIALAMASRPKIMLLDEIFDGIDPQKRDICRQLFTEYVAEYDCSVIISSHNLEELGNICDHIGLINGKALALDCCVDDIPNENKRFNVEFNSPVTYSNINQLPGVKKIKVSDTFATFMVLGKANIEAVEATLKSMDTSKIDIVPSTLEELFIAEMEDKSYDIHKIFS